MNLKNRFTSLRRFQSFNLGKVFLPVSILLLGLAFSWQQYIVARDQADAALKARFNVAFNEVTLHIIEKIEAYEQMLRATQGVFYASDSVSREQFRLFAKELELKKYYPGILGLGYVPLIKPEDKDRHIKQIRDSGMDEYRIYPEGERDFYTSILYLEPFSERNLRAFGFDMASEPNRRDAMLRARDTRKVALSAGVKLVQDLETETTTGLLMYLPLFKNATSVGQQTTQRQGEHQGWVYAVFRIEDVVNSTLHVSNNLQFLRISDITQTTKQTLFQKLETINENTNLRKTVNLAGRLWQFEAAPDSQFVANYENTSPLRGLLLGILFSIALAYIARLMINGRIRAEDLARQMTTKLRKQNLRLSLATETARMGIWDWNFDTNQIFLDGSSAALMLGKNSPEQRLSYQDWLQKVAQKDKKRLNRAIEKAINHRGDLNIEIQMQVAASETRMLQISGTLQLNDAGQPMGMLGVSFDITDSWLSQQQLSQAEARWKHALEGSGEGVWDWSIKDNAVQFSDKLIMMLGYQPIEFKPSFTEWSERIHPDDRQQAFDKVKFMLDGTNPDYYSEFRMRCKDDSWKWILSRGTVIERDADGHALRAVGTHSDIHLHKEAVLLLEQSEERFRNAFDTAPIGMALVGLDGRWLEVNEALCQMLGYYEDEFLSLTFMDITHPDDLDIDQQNVEKLINHELDSYQMEKRYFCKNGETIDVLLSVSVVHDADGQVLHFISQIEDITARKVEQERFRQLAFYDALTGLPNRRLFEDRISHALLTAQRNKQQLALMFIDIDHFKYINDSYGHDVGDWVIKAVADNMHAVLRASDTLARLGGDEFVVLLSDVPNSDSALKVAENLRKTLTEKLQFDDLTIGITLSIGVALWSSEQNETLASWMKKADIALYDVKARGRDGAILYQPSAD